MFDISQIQAALTEFQLDGWLLCDFRGSNPLAQKVVGIPASAHQTRRWMYFIPRVGSPKKLVHQIEAGSLDHLPGEKRKYLRWQDFEAGVAWLLSEVVVAGPQPKIAMEYSPRNAIPYISKVDAGTLELVQACGGVPVSSGDLIQQFEATWSDEQWQLYLQAHQVTTDAYAHVWHFIRNAIDNGHIIHETDVQDLIMEHFAKNNCVTDHPPIIGVNGNAGDPHYSPEKGRDSRINQGDLVLVDLWAKVNHPLGVFSDLTRMGYVGTSVPTEMNRLFGYVCQARDAAVALVKSRFASQQPLAGWEVDDACRRVLDEAGYGEAFCHRTGHNIGFSTHGNGAHMDNLETRDERRVLRRTCFSVEPGIYLPEQGLGFRSEINVFVDAQGEVHVMGGPLQHEIVPILK
jgi:Xaa-Pro dipeptidase